MPTSGVTKVIRVGIEVVVTESKPPKTVPGAGPDPSKSPVEEVVVTVETMDTRVVLL